MTELALIFGLLSVPLVIYLCLTDLLVFLGLAKVRGYAAGGPEQFLAPDGMPEDLYHELTELGFVPLGVYVEQCGPFKKFREFAWHSKKDLSYVAVYRLFPKEQPRVAFLTSFTNGAIAFTQNYEGGAEASDPLFWAGGVPGRALPRVLDVHRNRVREFIERGYEPTAGGTIESFLETQVIFNTNPCVYHSFRFTSLACAGHVLLMLALGPGLLMFLTGFDHPAPWALMLGECIFLAIVRWYGSHRVRHTTPAATAARRAKREAALDAPDA